MDRHTKKSSLKINTSIPCTKNDLTLEKVKVSCILFSSIMPFTLDQFIDLMAIIGMAYSIQVIGELIYLFIKEIINKIKKLQRHERDK